MTGVTLSLSDSVHATAVAHKGKAVILSGPSGSGKSSFALQLMAFGAQLISDDMVRLYEKDGAIWVGRPPAASGPVLIEARSMALMQTDPAKDSPVCCAIDLSITSKDRLPESKSLRIGNCDVRLFHKVDTPAFPAMILQYLKAETQG